MNRGALYSGKAPQGQAAATPLSNSARNVSVAVPATIRASSSRPFSSTRVDRRGIFSACARSPVPYWSQSTLMKVIAAS